MFPTRHAPSTLNYAEPQRFGSLWATDSQPELIYSGCVANRIKLRSALAPGNCACLAAIASLARRLKLRLELWDKPHIGWANREDFVADETFNTRPALPSGSIISPKIFEPHSAFLSNVVFDFVGLDETPDTVILDQLDQSLRSARLDKSVPNSPGDVARRMISKGNRVRGAVVRSKLMSTESPVGLGSKRIQNVL